MVKALAPITTVILICGAGFTELTTGKLINIVVIALAVIISSIGEFHFAWIGVISQVLGIVAESSHLVLLQRYLTASQDSTHDSQQANAADDELALTSSRSSSEYESDNGNAVVPSCCHSDDDDWRGLPVHGHGASETSQDDELGSRDYCGATQTSSLILLHYYAPVWAFLNGLMALVFERPVFDWKDLERVGVGMLVLSGGLASLASLMSFLLVITMFFSYLTATNGSLHISGLRLIQISLKISRSSALTMSFADILKSLLLVGASIAIWATPITVLQAFGYAISLAGMSYLALSAEYESPHVVLTEGLRRYAGWSRS